MKSLSLFLSALSNKKHDYLLRIFLSMLSSHLIIFYAMRLSYADLFSFTNYLKAFLINALMLYLLSSIVYRFIRLLEFYFLRSNLKNRDAPLWWRIFAPLLTAIALPTLYFAYNRMYKLETVFFGRSLQQIISLLIILNFYLFYQWQKAQSEKKIKN
jgi:hypothetical protein